MKSMIKRLQTGLAMAGGALCILTLLWMFIALALSFGPAYGHEPEHSSERFHDPVLGCDSWCLMKQAEYRREMAAYWELQQCLHHPRSAELFKAGIMPCQGIVPKQFR